MMVRLDGSGPLLSHHVHVGVGFFLKKKEKEKKRKGGVLSRIGGGKSSGVLGFRCCHRRISPAMECRMDWDGNGWIL